MLKSLMLLTFVSGGVLVATAKEADRPIGADVMFLGCQVGATAPTRYDCRYLINWPDDGHGAPDSLRIKDQEAGQTEIDMSHPPVPNSPPETLTVSRQRPAPRMSVTGQLRVLLVRRGLEGPVTVRTWAYTEPDVPPPAVTIDTLEVQAIWAEPRAVGRDTVVNGQTIKYVAAHDSTERCTFIQFGDSAVGRRNLGGSVSPLCTTLTAANVARWHRLSPAQQAIADTFQLGVGIRSVGPNLVLVVQHGPLGPSTPGWTPVPVCCTVAPYDTLPLPRVRTHGGAWRHKVLGYAVP